MLDSNTIVTFSKDVLPIVEMKSFWPAEDGFIWSAGKWCEIVLQYDVGRSQPGERAELVLDLDSFKSPPALEAQNVFIFLNGLRIGARRLNKRITAFIEFDPAILKPANTLIVDTPDATTPATFKGNDERVLGIQLFTFQIRYFPGNPN
jgi:hypothetical protein